MNPNQVMAQNQRNVTQKTLEDLKQETNTWLNEERISLSAGRERDQLEIEALKKQMVELQNWKRNSNSFLATAQKEKDEAHKALEELRRNTSTWLNEERTGLNALRRKDQLAIESLKKELAEQQQQNRILSKRLAFAERTRCQEDSGAQPAAGQSKELYCAVCYHEPVTVRLECGHACICEPCLDIHLGGGGGQCPICRKPIARNRAGVAQRVHRGIHISQEPGYVRP
mmetsp:Transcript_25710/g.40276  ORF Transcript_25710/g.40276 Transcript_25710/m.40276 type:complete len:228 (-) Transcript_25710:237-920(-)